MSRIAWQSRSARWRQGGLHALAVIILGALASPATAGLPSLSVPPGIAATVISRDMIIDGYHHEIVEFNSGMTLAEVLSWYRSTWKDSPPVTTAGHWSVLSLQSGDALTVVQTRPSNDGGTYALVSRRALQPARSSTGAGDLSLPHSLRILSYSRSASGQTGALAAFARTASVPTASATWVLAGLASIEDTLQTLQQSLEHDGWSVRGRHAAGHTASLHLVRDRRRLDAVLVPSREAVARGSGVLVVLSESEEP